MCIRDSIISFLGLLIEDSGLTKQQQGSCDSHSHKDPFQLFTVILYQSCLLYTSCLLQQQMYKDRNYSKDPFPEETIYEYVTKMRLEDPEM